MQGKGMSKLWKNVYKLLYHDKNEMVKFKMESIWRSNLAFISKYFNNLRHWRHEHLKNYPLSLKHDPYFDFTHIKSYEIRWWETLVAFCETKICEIFSCFDMETYFVDLLCQCRSGHRQGNSDPHCRDHALLWHLTHLLG